MNRKGGKDFNVLKSLSFAAKIGLSSALLTIEINSE